MPAHQFIYTSIPTYILIIYILHSLYIYITGFVLNDRLYNVEEIAKATIGTRAVIDDTQEVSKID